MTLKDITNGPGIIVLLVAVFMAIISIVFLTGNGADLIAGYNTADSSEKSKYDEKKMCRVMGTGMSVITVLLFVMAIWSAVLPASFAYIFICVVIADCVVMIVLLNTICKKK